MRIVLTIEVDTDDGGIKDSDALNVVWTVAKKMGTGVATSAFLKVPGRFGSKDAFARLEVTP